MSQNTLRLKAAAIFAVGVFALRLPAQQGARQLADAGCITGCCFCVNPEQFACPGDYADYCRIQGCGAYIQCELLDGAHCDQGGQDTMSITCQSP